MSLQAAAQRTGSQVPRVGHFPPYARSAAPEVIELAELAGLTLDPWQRYVLGHGLGETAEGQWAALKVGCWCPRQNGKGGIVEALELAWLFLLQERLVVHTAHEYKTSSEAFRRIKALVEESPDLDRCVGKVWQANGEQGIELTRRAGGGRLRFVARSRTSGRGFTGDKIILDEAQEMTGLAMSALLPTLSARPNPQVWLFGTPPTSGEAWCYSLRADGLARAPRVAWFDWGADLDPDVPGYRAAFLDRDLWYECNPALGIRIAEEFIEGELQPSGLGIGFGAERLGVWPTETVVGNGWEVIGKTEWAALYDRVSRIEGPVTYALDVSPDRSSASVGVAGPRFGGGTHIEVAAWEKGTQWVVPWFTSRGIDTVIVDEKGAAGFAELLENAEIDVIRPTLREFATAAGQFVDACHPDRQEIRHRNQPILNDAVAGAVTRHIGDAWVWDRRKPTVDISPVVACSLALWAYWRGLAEDYDILGSIG